MTPLINGVGQSWVSEDKLNGLACILRQHLAITREIWKKYSNIPKRYHFIDAYAGCGWNEQCDMPGSPIVFIEIARETGIHFDARFVEIRQDLFVPLRSKVREAMGGSEFSDPCLARAVNDDNLNFIPPYVGMAMMGAPIGMMFVDPNGIPNFKLLEWISRLNNAARLDFLIRYNATAVKRNKNGSTGRAWDHLKAVHKRFWQIRAPLAGDPWHWTFLLGTNCELNPWKSKGFHRIDSPEGQAIFEHIAYTEDELIERHQPCLDQSA